MAEKEFDVPEIVPENVGRTLKHILKEQFGFEEKLGATKHILGGIFDHDMRAIDFLVAIEEHYAIKGGKIEFPDMEMAQFHRITFGQVVRYVKKSLSQKEYRTYETPSAMDNYRSI